MRKTSIAILSILFFLPLFSHAKSDLFFLKKENKWAVYNKKGRKIHDHRFDGIKPIFENPVQYIVIEDGKYGLIDEKGKLILEPTYQDIKWYKKLNKRAIVYKGGTTYDHYKNDRHNFKVGAIDNFGKIILEPNYDVINYYAGYFSVGINVPNSREGSYSSGGSWGLFDENGKIIRDIIYEYCHTDGTYIYASRNKKKNNGEFRMKNKYYQQPFKV